MYFGNGHVACKGDDDWVQWTVVMKTERNRHMGVTEANGIVLTKI